MVAFLERLPVEVPGQLRQILIVEPDGLCRVLLRRGEFVADLVVQKFLVRAHPVNLVGTELFCLILWVM